MWRTRGKVWRTRGKVWRIRGKALRAPGKVTVNVHAIARYNAARNFPTKPDPQ
jgi:hypothetical protein